MAAAARTAGLVGREAVAPWSKGERSLCGGGEVCGPIAGGAAAPERRRRAKPLAVERGSVRPAYFREKYGVDISNRFGPALASLRADGYLMASDAEQVALTRDGLLRVDSLLPRFFLPEHTDLRYT